MNKATRHQPGAHSPASRRRPYKGGAPYTAQPDLIIIPSRETTSEQDGKQRFMHSTNLEYTAFEEIESAPSSVDDELAFQEYAGDDPARLRVTGRGGIA